MKGPTLKVSGPVAEVAASDGGVVLNIPITLKRRSGRRVVAIHGTEFESGKRTRTGATPLQLALARGHRWLRMLEAGEAASMSEIARHEGTDHSYVARHINLTLLAPGIVAAILDETLSEGVRLHALSINPPSLWNSQHQWLVIGSAKKTAQFLRFEDVETRVR